MFTVPTTLAGSSTIKHNQSNTSQLDGSCDDNDIDNVATTSTTTTRKRHYKQQRVINQLDGHSDSSDNENEDDDMMDDDVVKLMDKIGATDSVQTQPGSAAAAAGGEQHVEEVDHCIVYVCAFYNPDSSSRNCSLMCRMYHVCI